MRSGIVYGTVAMVDGRRAPGSRRSSAPDAVRRRHRRPRRRWSSRHSRADRRERPAAHPGGPAHRARAERAPAAPPAGRCRGEEAHAGRSWPSAPPTPRPAEEAASRGPGPVARAVRDRPACGCENRLVQAPLAGIANWAFRRQSRRHGAGLAVSEMIASFGIRHAEPQDDGDARRSRRTSTRSGCRSSAPTPTRWPRPPARSRRPAPTWSTSTWAARSRRSARPGAGAALLADPASAARRSSRRWCDAVDIPVTVKMRRGLTPAGRDARRDRPAPRGGRRRRALRPPPRRGRGVRGPRRPPHHRRGRRGGRRCRSSRAATSSTPSDARRVLEDTGCAAVAVGRARARLPVGLRRHPARRRTGPRPTLDEVVDEIAALRRRRAGSPWASRGALRLHAQVLPAGTSPATTCRPASSRRCSPPRRWTAPSRACGRSPRLRPPLDPPGARRYLSPPPPRDRDNGRSPPRWTAK